MSNNRLETYGVKGNYKTYKPWDVAAYITYDSPTYSNTCAPLNEQVITDPACVER